ncbi:MAG: GTPase HflX, partial [Oscillospiraceae bacterium]|nr:GTPase HflX [Oscillospiraceae bacterium]
ADSQTEVTRELLQSLKADKAPMLNVLNKCDLIEGELPICTDDCVLISATGFGIDEMLGKLAKMLPPSQIRMNLLIPYSAGGISAEIRESGKIFSEEFTENGVLTDALVDVKMLHKVEGYQI